MIDHLKPFVDFILRSLMAAAGMWLALGPAHAQSELESQLPETLMPSLAEILEIALEASDQMVTRDLAETEAEGRRVAYRSAVLPSFGVNFSYRQEEDQNALKAGFEERMIYQVALTQPLYHWGARRAEQQMGALLYDIELLNSQSVAERIVGNLRALYMNLIVDRQELEANRAALEMKRRELETQQERMSQGVASAADIFGAELDLERLELSQAQSVSRWQTRLSELAEQLRVEPTALEERLAAEIPPVERMEPETIRGMSAHFDRGLATSEAVQRKDLEIQLDRKRLRIERTALRPHVDLQAGVSQNALDADGVRREQEFIYAGFRVNWAIFDGFRAKGRTAEARARLERNELSKAVLEKSLLREYDRALSNLEVASRALSIEEKLLANRAGGYAKADEDLSEGRISENQFQELEQNYRRQFIKTQQSRATYLNAISDLSLLLGIDPEAMTGQARQ